MATDEHSLDRIPKLIASLPSSAARTLELLAPLILPLALGVALGMCIAAYWVQPIWDEQAWYLYAGGRALAGARLYSADLVDVNPPLIIWFSELPMALAHALGLAPTLALKLCVAALSVASLAWCCRLIQAAGDVFPPRLAAGFAVVGVYVLGVYPAADLGQREHLIVVLSLPYLVMAATRLAGRSQPPAQAAVAGALVALGVCFKPYYLLMLLAVELMLLLRRPGLRGVFRTETVAIAATGLAYCATVWLQTPAYIKTYVPLLLELYRDVGDNDWRTVLPLSRIAKIGGLILVCLVLGRRLRSEPLVTLFVAAGIASAVVYVVQGKAWAYQLLPEASYLRFAAGLIIAELVLRCVVLPLAAAPLLPGRAIAAAATGAMLAALLYLPSQHAMARDQWADDMVTEYLDATARYPAGSAILVLSPNTYYAHQVALDRGFVWPSRFPQLWMLPGIMRNEQNFAGVRQPLPPQRVAALAQETRTALAEDLQRWRPAAVLVERCSEAKPCYSLEGLQVDLAEWFNRDAGFRKAWSSYRLDHQLDIYDVYLRTDATAGS